MHVGVVAIAGTFDSGLTGVLDVLRAAEALRPTVDPEIPPLRYDVIGLRPTVLTANGLLITPDRQLDDGVDDLDVLVVPAPGALTVGGVRDALGAPEVRELVGALRDGVAGSVRELAGACTGTFVLAEAGRLDAARATTTWWLADEFRRRYPHVELDTTRMVIGGGDVLTAGAAFAHIDLAIELVARVSAQLADVVARHLLVDERPAASVAAVGNHLRAADGLVTEFDTWVRERLDEPISVVEAAAALGTTRRTLERRVRARTGHSPGAMIVRMRLERARHLRLTSERSWDQIAPLVGYGSGAALRRRLRAA